VKRFVLLCLLPVFASAADLSPTGMTQVLNGVDDSAYHVELGHTFPHLDKVFTDAWMSTNGFILLWSPTNNLGQQTLPTGGHCCDGYNFGAGTPNYLDNRVGQFSYMLAPLWTDLDDTNVFDDDGYYYSTNTERSSFLWYKVREYNNPLAMNTFQLNIDKSGGFEYIYDDVFINNHEVFIGWTGDTAADPFWHTQQFYGNKFTMSSTYANATGAQLISAYGGDLSTNSYSNGNFGLVGRPDCTNPANDSTCDGYWDAVAQSSVTDQYTDNVFGDEVEDYFFTDNQSRQGQPQTTPPPQPYQNTSQEREMFGLAPRADEPPTGEPERPEQQRQQQQQQPEPIVRTEPERVERPVEVAEEPVQVVRESRPEPRPDRAVVRQEPVEVERVQREERVEIVREPEPEKEAEKVIEREVIRPAVDVVGIALSTVGQSAYRNNSVNSQTQMVLQDQQELEQTTSVFSTEAQITQVVAQQAQQQKTNTITTSELAPPTQMQFENDFNDAIATGQSVGQFLSAQLPDFSRFDVSPPSQDEQRTVQRAETQIQTMSQADVQQSLDSQLENLEDTGGFTDQSLAVFLISNNPAFSQYDNVNISDRQQFYSSTQPYPSNSIRANPLGVLRVTGNSGYDDLVDLQWQR
tara:strand:- start:12862 stop:14766 length:1905 start_codon:yes stop_codon:yes gene_type:complete